MNIVEAEPADEYTWIGMIQGTRGQQNTNSWWAKIQVQGVDLRMKIDSGAEAKVLPKSVFETLMDKPTIRTSKTKLKAFGGGIVQPLGVATINYRAGESSACHDTFITQEACPILSLHTSVALGLIGQGPNGNLIGMNSLTTKTITKESLLEEYPEVFKGTGRYPGKYHIHQKPDVEPRIQPPRRVPPALQGKLKEKLDDMESSNIIKAVDEPTEWVNNIVIAQKKDGSLRICLDPKELNKSIKREHFEIPTFDQVVQQLGNKKYSR